VKVSYQSVPCLLLNGSSASSQKASLNLNQCESLKISENSLNLNQYITVEKISCTVLNPVNFHYISETLTDSNLLQRLHRFKKKYKEN